jgi:hypothetical protein
MFTSIHMIGAMGMGSIEDFFTSFQDGVLKELADEPVLSWEMELDRFIRIHPEMRKAIELM